MVANYLDSHKVSTDEFQYHDHSHNFPIDQNMSREMNDMTDPPQKQSYNQLKSILKIPQA